MAAEASQEIHLPATGLLLVGMGMGRLEGMTHEALQAASAAEHRRYEAYTALWPDEELERLEARIGAIQRVMRPEVEEPDELLALASTSLVALLVVGDPLQATTHVDLQLRAAEAGVECRVFHGLSITTLVTGAVGLSNYKFGRQTTLTYPYGGWIATSPLEVVAVNWAQNLHTLALLDLDPTGQGTGEQQPMTPADAANAMRLMWTKLSDAEPREEVADTAQRSKHAMVEEFLDRAIDDVRVVLCSDMGTPDQALVTTTMGKLGHEKGGRLNCLVFPAGTGEIEEKALARWKGGAR